MSVVNLGSVKNAPKYTEFVTVPVIWKANLEKIDINFTFKPDRTYLVFLRSNMGVVKIENNDVSVTTTEVLSNQPIGYSFSGGNVFNPIADNIFSFGLTLPESHNGVNGIYVRKTKSAGVASIFDVGIFEL